MAKRKKKRIKSSRRLTLPKRDKYGRFQSAKRKRPLPPPKRSKTGQFLPGPVKGSKRFKAEAKRAVAKPKPGRKPKKLSLQALQLVGSYQLQGKFTPETGSFLYLIYEADLIEENIARFCKGIEQFERGGKYWLSANLVDGDGNAHWRQVFGAFRNDTTSYADRIAQILAMLDKREYQKTYVTIERVVIKVAFDESQFDEEELDELEDFGEETV